MTVIIATPHGVEAVEAVVQYAEDGSNAEAIADFRNPFLREVFEAPTGSRNHATYEACARYYLDNENIAPGQFLAKSVDGVTFTVHDTDPRIEPTWEWGYSRDGGKIRGERDERTAREDASYYGRCVVMRKAHYPVTLAGKPYTLVGEWVEVADA